MAKPVRTPTGLLGLQRAAGNRAVGMLVQRQLTEVSGKKRKVVAYASVQSHPAVVKADELVRGVIRAAATPKGPNIEFSSPGELVDKATKLAEKPNGKLIRALDEYSLELLRGRLPNGSFPRTRSNGGLRSCAKGRCRRTRWSQSPYYRRVSPSPTRTS
jgi:hypothetical protein